MMAHRLRAEAAREELRMQYRDEELARTHDRDIARMRTEIRMAARDLRRLAERLEQAPEHQNPAEITSTAAEAAHNAAHAVLGLREYCAQRWGLIPTPIPAISEEVQAAYATPLTRIATGSDKQPLGG